MRWLILPFVIIIVTISGCNSGSNDDIPFSQYKMPVDYDVQAFEVTKESSYIMEQVEIAHSSKANLSEIWLENKNRKEAQDKYDMVREIVDDSEIEAEEEELELYCNSIFSNSCLEMEFIHDHNGCRRVDVECKKYNGDDICIRYDIAIKPEKLDDDECS
ncbi:hypothetical protein JXB31_04785 [Candidatus Woesearchaeota archaeon]|nr:hypothetical protein [Candidatus Woesearchaeota archaeon]